MDPTFDREEQVILSLLRKALSGGRKKTPEDARERLREMAGETDWEKVFRIADSHGVTALVYDQVRELGGWEPELRNRVRARSESTVLQSYHLLFLAKAIVKLLEEQDIPVVVLKGSCAAEFYPVPELRKSGDLDLLLLRAEDVDRVEDVFAGYGINKLQEQHAAYHVAFATTNGIEIEVHVTFTENFDKNSVNEYMQTVYASCKDHVLVKDVMEVSLPTLEDGYFAFCLLLHMLHHFLRSGFGIKLFCDWVAFWSRPMDERERETYQRLVKGCGLEVFSQTITAACIAWLGLDARWVSFMYDEVPTKEKAKERSRDMMREVLDAEEFGRSTTDRMVMLRKGGLAGYVIEFHHQTCLNFPRLSKVFVCWPVLWVIMLIKFQYNNRKVRNVSWRDILKNANERGKLIKDMKLFE